jgi:hypothetical protein
VFKHIEITLHLGVKTKQKGDRVIALFREAFEHPFSIQSFERNVDDLSLFRVDLITPLGTDNIEHAVYRTLEACSRFARSWTVTGPHEVEGGGMEFSGWAQKGQMAIPGIESAGFEISNYQE